jgi:YidC/Oxa1 family membrane protein insertase
LWQALVNGIAAMLSFFYGITKALGIPSYGLAIIFLTLVIKIVLYPLSYKQMHSMKKMQDIQPKVKELQEKYKKNPEKANQAIMELYKENKVNPMSGCLPLLVQMPILIALFQALRDFVYVDPAAAKFLWVPHLKDPDPYYIIPVLVALTTYLQSKVTTPASGDNPAAEQTQKMMLYFMPLFIGYISLNFPAGLGIYWTFFSIFGALQQLYINRQPAMQKGEVGGK